MAITLASLKQRRVLQPPRVLVYGPAGIGKTNLGAGTPNPIYLPIEDGLTGMIDVPAFPLINTFAELTEAIGWLASEEHDFQTATLDSLDWLERLVHQEACRQNGWASIETPDYGKGYTAALEVWKYVLDGFDALRNRRGMGLVLIAHASVVNFKSPEVTPYDRYKPKLHESGKGNGANPLIQEAVDCIFFMNWKTSVVRDREKGDKAGEGHARGIGGNTRMVYTEERPAWLAKNRFSMPPEIQLPNDPALAWPTVAQFIPFYSQQSAQVAA